MKKSKVWVAIITAISLLALGDDGSAQQVRQV